MKFFIVSLALVASVVADVSELGYGYNGPAVEHSHGGGGGNVGGGSGIFSSSFAGFGVGFGGGDVSFGGADDGDVVVTNSYIPPAAPAHPQNLGSDHAHHHAAAPVNTYIPAAAPAPVSVNAYIPPASGSSFGGDAGFVSSGGAGGFGGDAGGFGGDAGFGGAGGATDFGDDGYRYRTVRRRVHRKRV